jgi:hypothetical protein
MQDSRVAETQRLCLTFGHGEPETKEIGGHGMKMSSAEKEDPETAFFVHRTAAFERNLKALHRKGGTASMAAAKAEAAIRQIVGIKEEYLRRQFRLTRCGEYRIKHCGKYDLSCGYRLVFVRRKGHIAFLYVGSHDDCVRWIDRNRRLVFDAAASQASQIAGCRLTEDSSIFDKDDADADEYEALLMSRLSDMTLRKIFSGFAEQ